MRVLIVGASRGIGAELADLFAARGDAVIGTARRPLPGQIPLDVRQPEQFEALHDRLAGQPLDLLVCNAGILPGRNETLDHGYPAAMWAETFAVNVMGVFLAVQAVLPSLREAEGKIAILSSQLGSSTHAGGGRLIYRASKAAAINLGRNLAIELAADGVAVGIYHPGWVRTDMGGPDAAITTRQSAAGLAARFDALTVATTGVFKTWDGRPHDL
ncbi:oxidoreductase, short-chain dehydrogenase/reductase family protein [Oceaniovalibus guishaninsula JLT2003]|uniref:Oxidoreductase, short-chain dehydrogenase/reductase family protein n=1 Tax=Oceaniovalibus guishaninsula JLT2003 TaxID=1231392 RepID=K2HCE5_9RHOB|nr:SDR family NAD(P)-dependent oxidoreductase [Oceaniovalibus guishaninsula]EKE45108.1 oxidoreductase, short-chain dehydrogenase/reductase family protein [Oceaniovalibus guishaninsula JLT2003]